MTTHEAGTAIASNSGGEADQSGDIASLNVRARVGLIACGVVHILIGWLALGMRGARRATTRPTPLGR